MFKKTVRILSSNFCLCPRLSLGLCTRQIMTMESTEKQIKMKRRLLP